MVERETGPGQEAVENVVEGDEHGDWLDSFVVEATQGEDPIRSRQNSHYQHSERGGSRVYKRCHYSKSISEISTFVRNERAFANNTILRKKTKLVRNRETPRSGCLYLAACALCQRAVKLPVHAVFG